MIIASIDIGTNTIILLVAEADIKNKKILSIYNEQRIPRLGKGLLPGKPISDEKIHELVIILSDYYSIIKKFKCEKIYVTATNALRIASNKNDLKELIKEKFGFDLNIVSGEDEADLTFKGAVFSYPDNSGSIVIDIGGGSTEIIAGNINNIYFKKSYQAGVVTLKERFLMHSPPLPGEMKDLKRYLNHFFRDLVKKEIEFQRAFAIAGTPTTLGAMRLNLGQYNEDKLEGYLLKIKDIEGFAAELSELKDEEIIQRYKAVVKGREDVILSGTIILLHLMNLLKINEVIVTTKGIRYGAVYTDLLNL
jgi:exopolyphosphatase/guanosine-5'-triphosphate,3'-diphosphate pyrophosphatase